MVAKRVLRATGSTVGCWDVGEILDRVQDAIGYAVGVGCAVGVGGVSWGALDGTLGAECVARRRFRWEEIARVRQGTQVRVLAKQHQALALGLPSRR